MILVKGEYTHQAHIFVQKVSAGLVKVCAGLVGASAGLARASAGLVGASAGLVRVSSGLAGASAGLVKVYGSHVEQSSLWGILVLF